MEYKFRGKRKYNGDWVYGDLWRNLTNPEKPLYKISYWIMEEVNEEGVNVNHEVDVIPETVGMWTRMKDKNGKEIYEGDIIQFAEKYFYLVKFEDAKFVGYHANNDWGKWGDLYKIAESEFSKYDYFVIGNIHDNPRLVNPGSGQSAINNMLDPNTQQATEEVKAEGQEIAAVESEAQEKALESAEEGGTEG